MPAKPIVNEIWTCREYEHAPRHVRIVEVTETDVIMRNCDGDTGEFQQGARRNAVRMDQFLGRYHCPRGPVSK